MSLKIKNKLNPVGKKVIQIIDDDDDDDKQLPITKIQEQKPLKENIKTSSVIEKNNKLDQKSSKKEKIVITIETPQDDITKILLKEKLETEEILTLFAISMEEFKNLNDKINFDRKETAAYIVQCLCTSASLKVNKDTNILTIKQLNDFVLKILNWIENNENKLDNKDFKRLGRLYNSIMVISLRLYDLTTK